MQPKISNTNTQKQFPRSGGHNFKRVPAPDGKAYNINMDKLLGKGTFAQVYMAALEKPQTRDAPADQNCGNPSIDDIDQQQQAEPLAMKIISSQNLKRWGDKGRRNLQRELHILSIIKHRNIVRLDDFIQTANNYYLVFEYCNGGDLATYLKNKGPLDEFEAQSIVYQIGQALKQLFLNEIMHRDLKPQNILLQYTDGQEWPNVKLADFGLAKYQQSPMDDDDGLQENTVCGTPVYMAPEILNIREYGAEADLWSIGAIFLELIIGNKAWQLAKNRAEIADLKKKFFYKFANGAVDLESMDIHTSPLYANFLAQLLQQDPKKRMTWSDFFQSPVVANDPKVYHELIFKITQRPVDFIQKSNLDESSRLEEEQKLEESVDKLQLSDKIDSENSAEVKEVDDFKNAEENPLTGSETHINTIDITMDILSQLLDQAQQLRLLIESELNNKEPNGLQIASYPFASELGFLVLKTLMETREALEIFCTEEFLALANKQIQLSKAKELAQVDIQKQEELVKSIIGQKEKNNVIKSKLQQWHRKQQSSSIQIDKENEKNAGQIQEDLVREASQLSVLVRAVQALAVNDSNGNQQKPPSDQKTVAFNIALQDQFLKNVMESQGQKIIQSIYQLQDCYIHLSNFLKNSNFQDNCFMGENDNDLGKSQKQLGQRLLSFAVDLGEQAGIEESLFNSQKAYDKYQSSLLIIRECLRLLNLECRFENSYSKDIVQNAEKPINEDKVEQPNMAGQQLICGQENNQYKPQSLFGSKEAPAPTSDFQVLSYSFNREDEVKELVQNGMQKECIFDIKTELILLGLQLMVEERISVVQKSPYFSEQN